MATRRIGPWKSLGPILEELEDLDTRVTDVEDEVSTIGGIDVKVLWFEQINSGTSGTLSAPTGGTIELDQWAAGVDALACGMSGGLPTFQTVLDTGGSPITATLDVGGNWTISGTPASGYPVALIYVYKIDTSDFDETKSLESAQVAPRNTLGPVTSTDNALARWDSTTGRILQDSGVTISDTNFLSFPTGVSVDRILDDDNLSPDSASALATQQSIKAYVDNQVGGIPLDKIEEGNSKVEVVDTGTGQIDMVVDGNTIVEVYDGTIQMNADVTITGTTTTINTDELTVEDNLITINFGEAGAGVTAGSAGIQVDRGSLTDFQFLFDETSDKFKVGQIGSLQVVATREDAPTDTQIAYWNASQNRFDTVSSPAYTALVTLTGTQTLTNKTLTSPIINTILAQAGETGISIAADGAVELYFDNAKEAETQSGSFKATNGFVINASGTMTGIQTTITDTDTQLCTSGAVVDYVPTVSINEVSEDGTPQLGGDLDLNGNNIDLGAILTVNGTYEGTILTATVDDAGADLGEVLAQAADFNYDLADADAAANSAGLVMALESGAGSKKVLIEGQICNTAWNWSSGFLYLDVTAGAMTQTAPSGSGDQVVVLGWALSADTIYFKPSLVLVENA